MWNSPHSLSKTGRRYRLEKISALVLPLDEILDQGTRGAISDIVDEAILKRIENHEFIFLIYQVLQALLEEVAVPKGGHTGNQEAMIAELLNQSYAKIVCELEMSDFGHSARKTVWTSIDRLLIHRDPAEPCLPSILEDAGLELSEPKPYLSEKLTREVWAELLLSEDFLLNEFLWDTDWRMGFIMDLHPDQAEALTKMAGLDLDVVQALPHTPNAPEFRMAEHYISYVIWKNEARMLEVKDG